MRTCEPQATIRMVISDVDGTLVTPEKHLTRPTIDVVHRLRAAGLRFTIASSRPPRGMRMIAEPLAVDVPAAAFNGGMIVDRGGSVLEAHTLSEDVARAVVGVIGQHGLEPWVYRGEEWVVRRLDLPRVQHEQETVRFAPTVVADMSTVLADAVKIVGVSDDYGAVERCDVDLRARLGSAISAARSHPYYVDITHPDANKGAAVRRLSELAGVPLAQVATIGDMPTDTLMFALSGFSIAMGNASIEVQKAAQCVTSSNVEDGFAQALERWILGARPHS